MWIEFSEFNIKLLIPLIFPVFKRLQDFEKKSYIIKDNQLFKTFRYFTSYILSFVFLIIIYLRTRKKNSEEIEKKETLENRITLSQSMSISISSNTIEDLKIKNTKKMKIKSYLFLALLCAMGLFCYFFRYFFEKDEYRNAKQSIGIFFDIAGYIILSYLILKQKLYLHSYVTMGIIGFILLILFIISTFYIEGEYILKSFVYYFCYSLSFVLYDILKKKYMILFFNTPYFMMLVIGIVNVIFALIYDVIAYNVDDDGNYEGIITGLRLNVTTAGSFFLMVLEIFLQFFWNLGIWLTIYYLTPCHYFISEYISEYLYYMENANNSNGDEFYSTVNIVLFSISYFINFFCCLVFNEVIILNFCGMDYNTKKRIKERTSNERMPKVEPLLEMSTDEIEERDSLLSQ